MGVFYVECSVQDVTGSERGATVANVLVDTGSEYTWLPEEALTEAGISVRKRDVPFVMANGQRITRHVGYAIIRCEGFETVDEVVFAREGDLRLLGSRTLEGFGAVIDARQRKLVSAGPYPVAGTSLRPNLVHPSLQAGAWESASMPPPLGGGEKCPSGGSL